MNDIFSRIVSLFFVLNIIGNIPTFIGILSKFDLKHQRKIMIRESIIALIILLLFNYFGNVILKVLGITRPIIGIAGGALLFLIAITMIFPNQSTSNNIEHEPIIVPLAIPVIAGPGSITTVMVFSTQINNHFLMTLIIIAAMIPSIILLLISSNIKYFLGTKGLVAAERLGGMLISLISIQMLFSGIIDLVKMNFNL